MDNEWYFPDMVQLANPDPALIPVWSLYGESRSFPDVLHIERFSDRASGLDWRIAPHRHLHLHQFFLFQCGAARISVDGQAPDLTFPMLLNIPRGVVHEIAMDAGTEGWVLTVPDQTLPELLGPALSQESGLGWIGALPADAPFVSLFERIAEEHRLSRPAREVMLRAMAAELGCLVLRGLGTTRAPMAGDDPRFLQFQTLLSQHLRDRWILNDYARAIGMSERHLSRVCRKSAGQPASALIEAAAMREASRLLVYTRMPVAQIGYALGFDDPSYFSRAFRRVTGLSPARYRAAYER